MKKIEKRFCEKCGCEMLDDFVLHHYSIVTGARIYIVKTSCILREHFWDRHDHYTRVRFNSDHATTAYYLIDGTRVDYAGNELSQ